ncbi:hypothetical protein ACF06W_11260 [Streptomyces albus]|uniref:hypothetical protein n=1 Tax=Streptomyces albus TaxID=1888 RepID=UPI0036F756C0
MRCSTDPSSIAPTDDPCGGDATHMLLGSIRDGETGTREPFMDPVCKPCGESFTRRPALKARLVPLHVRIPGGAVIDVIEGHRLVTDPEHEVRCLDCGTTGSRTSFRFRTNGCSGRPESITVLRYSREFLRSGLDRSVKSAQMWWDYAVGYLRMQVEDWRVVTDHAEYSAYFTFRDREYAVKHNLLDFRFGAVKLPNRGWPEPLTSGPDRDYRQAVFYFHNRVTDSGSKYFATWTPGYVNVADRELIKLYTPESQISEVLYAPGLRSWAEMTDAVCDAFGPISDITLQTRIFE